MSDHTTPSAAQLRQDADVMRKLAFECEPPPLLRDAHLRAAAALDAEAARLERETLHKQWPLNDAVNRVVRAAQHLLDIHDCDCCGHEEIRFAIKALEHRLDNDAQHADRRGWGVMRDDGVLLPEFHSRELYAEREVTILRDSNTHHHRAVPVRLTTEGA